MQRRCRMQEDCWVSNSCKSACFTLGALSVSFCGTADSLHFPRASGVSIFFPLASRCRTVGAVDVHALALALAHARGIRALSGSNGSRYSFSVRLQLSVFGDGSNVVSVGVWRDANASGIAIRSWALYRATARHRNACSWSTSGHTMRPTERWTN